MALISTLAANRRRLVMGAALMAVLAAAGCGRRGALEAPPGVTVAPKPAQPQRMAAPVAQVVTSDFGELDNNRNMVAEKPAQSLEGQTRPVAVEPAPVDPNKPKKSFLLDPLVN
jgi:predicted small lipoprotein YifL